MEQVEYLVGKDITKQCFEGSNCCKTLRPFSEDVCDFLEGLSKKIKESREAQEYQDVVSLGFWCRKANISKMKDRYNKLEIRLGRGIAFHIAPSNVPINTFYSLFLGLLAGCKNVVRTSSKEFPQIRLVAKYINELIEDDYKELQEYIYIIRYAKDSNWTKYFSSRCQVRVIWGGDATIETLSKISTSSRCKDIRFADRYSFAIIEGKKLVDSNEEELKKLAHSFYNDTYLTDQNACSSPHLVFWLNNGVEEKKMQKTKNEFWKAVYKASLRYDLEEIKCTDKYTMLCDAVMMNNDINSVQKYGNSLYVCQLKLVPKDIEYIRGKYGLFFEYEGGQLSDVMNNLSEKTQTCLYYGDIKEKILNEIENGGLLCVDRIVPMGRSLNISEKWDGYNLIEEMSRIIVCE